MGQQNREKKGVSQNPSTACSCECWKKNLVPALGPDIPQRTPHHPQPPSEATAGIPLGQNCEHRCREDVSEGAAATQLLCLLRGTARAHPTCQTVPSIC